MEDIAALYGNSRMSIGRLLVTVSIDVRMRNVMLLGRDSRYYCTTTTFVARTYSVVYPFLFYDN
jgi:hypothetical protein